MSLRSDLLNLVWSLVPTASNRVRIRGNQQPAAVSHVMDVDLLHASLRNAESGDVTQLFALYRDIISGHAHTQGEFGKRKLAVLAEGMTLTSANPKNPAEVELNKAVQAHLLDRPGWLTFLSHSLDAALYPIALSSRSYNPSSRPGWRYEIADLSPVPHIHLQWPNGILQIRETNEDGMFNGQFDTPSTRTHILHRSNILTSVPDWWGGPMRAVLFWWLFATQSREWWIRFLDRFGSPFLVGRYNETDDAARWSLQSAFSQATRIFGIVATKDTEIEVKEANSSGGGQAFSQFHDVANREISKLIIGQTSSAEIQKSGLGDSQGAAQAGVREDIRKFDAHTLAHTVKTQILAPLWRFNGWTHPLPTVSFGTISEEDSVLTGEFLASLSTAGIELADDGLEKLSARHGYGFRRIVNIPKPIALSARREPALLTSVARRAARGRQARSAVAALVESASPKLARIMTARAEQMAAALEESDTPEAAASAIAALAADFDPGTASDLIAAVLSSAAANAVIQLD